MFAHSLRVLGFFSVIAASALSAQAAHAQVDAQRYGSDRAVRCDSNDNRLQRCAADTRGGVRLLRQVSKSSCVEGRSWGYDRSGIWVNNGCRAEFALGGGGWGGGWGGDGGGDGRTVRCDSNDNRYQQCAIDGRDARLVRQYSKSACVEGRSWGVGRGFVWVNNGCRAEFATGYGGGHGGGWNGGNGGGHGGGGWNGGGPAQTLYCGSDDNRPRRCNVTIRRDARMVQQKSKSACIEGRSWGWDRDGIWVSNGCRADFQVR
ncbi:DUF3011 domain-containing protein [Lysobacter soli]|uniref:DUF3011 domain-containing protein n=1 Tax=Lysobacter soli TaxID=453783 RepID=UPI0037C7B64E